MMMGERSEKRTGERPRRAEPGRAPSPRTAALQVRRHPTSSYFLRAHRSSYYDTHDNFFYDASGFKMVRTAALPPLTRLCLALTRLHFAPC